MRNAVGTDEDIVATRGEREWVKNCDVGQWTPL